MNRAKIAEFVLHRANMLTPCVRIADARAALGEDYAHAISHGYLTAELETGEMFITNSAARINELRQVFEDETNVEVGDEVAVVANGQTYQASVATTADGKYKLSYKQGRPASNADREFNRDELKLQKKGPKASPEVARMIPRNSGGNGNPTNA
jgi:hypothetical protein